MKRLLMSGALALGLGLVGVGPASAATTTTTVTVTPSQLLYNTPPTAAGQFVAINQSGKLGSVGIVVGPATPPLGSGSLQLSVTQST